MTIHELSQFQFLKKEIELTKKQIKQLETLATKSTQTFSILLKDSNFENRRKKYGSTIANLIINLEANLNKCLDEFCKINNYIKQIDNSMVRQIIIYRFFESYSWAEIAKQIGGNNTADGVRKIMVRYLKEK